MIKLFTWIKSVWSKWFSQKTSISAVASVILDQPKIIYIENKVQVLRGLGTVALKKSETQEYLQEIEFSQQEDKHIQ